MKILLPKYPKFVPVRCVWLIAAMLLWGSAFFAISGEFPIKIEIGGDGTPGASMKNLLGSPAKADSRVASLFQVHVKTSLKTVKRVAITDILELKSKTAASRRQGARQNAAGMDDRYADSFGTDKPIDLADYDELWVDYRGSYREPAGGIRVSLPILASDFLTDIPIQLYPLAVVLPIKSVEEVDVSSAGWRLKDYTYSLGRTLRLPPEGEWRYIPWREFTVIQRRFHRYLAGVEALDVVLDSEVEGINLRIGTKDNYAPGELVELGRAHLGDGESLEKHAYRINVSQLLRERFPNCKTVYLQEICIFIRGNDPEVTAGRPLKKLIFKAVDDAASKPGSDLLGEDSRGMPAQRLPATILSASPTVKRLVVDLRGLKKYRHAFFTRGAVNFAAKTASPDERDFSKIRLVRVRDKLSAVFLRDGEDLLRSWGGPFINPEDPRGYVEWPEVFVHLAFRVLAPSSSAPVYARNRLGRGALSLNSEKPFKAAASAEGLLLEGFGDSLSLSFSTSSVISAGSVFVLVADYGSRQISRTFLSVDFKDGPDVRLPVFPNEPIMIPRGGPVNNISLVLYSANRPFRINLKEAVLFHPRLLTEAQAFFGKIPVKYHGYSKFAGGEEVYGSPSIKMVSAAEDWLAWPILSTGRSIGGITFNKEPGGRILRGPLWTVSSTVAVSQIILSSGIITGVESPWFSLDSTIAVPLSGRLPEFVLDGTVNSPHALSGKSFRSQSSAKLISLLAILLLLWRIRVKFPSTNAGNLNVKTLALLRNIHLVLIRVPRLVSIACGGLGLVAYTAGMSNHPGFNPDLWFSFGGLTAVLCLRFALEAFRAYFERFSPKISVAIWNNKAKPFFACAVFLLFAAAMMAILHAQPIAEQLSIMVFYALSIGVVWEGVALYVESRRA